MFASGVVGSIVTGAIVTTSVRTGWGVVDDGDVQAESNREIKTNK
jgi:hypothetical protein